MYMAAAAATTPRSQNSEEVPERLAFDEAERSRRLADLAGRAALVGATQGHTHDGRTSDLLGPDDWEREHRPQLVVGVGLADLAWVCCPWGEGGKRGSRASEGAPVQADGAPMAERERGMERNERGTQMERDME